MSLEQKCNPAFGIFQKKIFVYWKYLGSGYSKTKKNPRNQYHNSLEETFP